MGEPTTSQRIRKAAGISDDREPFFRRATPRSTGSGPVEVNIRKAADPGSWLHQVVARHRANVYDWRGDGQPTGTPAEAPGSLRVEGITESSRADQLAQLVGGFREKFGREPTDRELGALLTLLDGRIRDRRFGDESATVPPGSRA